MAISFLGEYRFPTTDDANDTGSTLTLDESAIIGADGNPPTLQTNDFVVVLVEIRQLAGTWSVTTTGGQTWTEQNDAVNTMSKAMYTCFFNGTWTADPVFTSDQAASSRLLWAQVWRGVDTSTPWDVTPVFTTRASAASYTEATYNTNTNGAYALGGAGSVDNNTWSVDNSFATPPSFFSTMYWRSSGGTDASMALAGKAMPTAGAVGATVWTLATLANDAGYSWRGALKPAAAATGSLVYPTGISQALLVR